MAKYVKLLKWFHNKLITFETIIRSINKFITYYVEIFSQESSTVVTI